LMALREDSTSRRRGRTGGWRQIQLHKPI